MYPLPIFNAALVPCLVSPALLAPHEQGQFCRQTARPLAELAAAPTGRACGRFAASQVQRPPRLSRCLRWFVAVLVLVVAQGLTAHEALAQVRRPLPPVPHKAKSKPHRVARESLPHSFNDGKPTGEPPVEIGKRVYTYVQQMPVMQKGGIREVISYIEQHLQWPTGTEMLDAEGRVYVSFVVDSVGYVGRASVLKGLHPLLDAEALRVVRALPRFQPGRQDGRPVAVSFTIPVTFRRN